MCEYGKRCIYMYSESVKHFPTRSLRNRLTKYFLYKRKARTKFQKHLYQTSRTRRKVKKGEAENDFVGDERSVRLLVDLTRVLPGTPRSFIITA